MDIKEEEEVSRAAAARPLLSCAVKVSQLGWLTIKSDRRAMGSGWPHFGPVLLRPLPDWRWRSEEEQNAEKKQSRR
ncbi:hypothetical protein TYRP_023756 [Tyrophagus putrescentiae]|nr:hypothetical protein TYRP_023756 [Tyrophagus putrescentiae]